MRLMEDPSIPPAGSNDAGMGFGSNAELRSVQYLSVPGYIRLGCQHENKVDNFASWEQLAEWRILYHQMA
jgi:hypothetical protein